LGHFGPINGPGKKIYIRGLERLYKSYIRTYGGIRKVGRISYIPKFSKTLQNIENQGAQKNGLRTFFLFPWGNRGLKKLIWRKLFLPGRRERE